MNLIPTFAISLRYSTTYNPITAFQHIPHNGSIRSSSICKRRASSLLSPRITLRSQSSGLQTLGSQRKEKPSSVPCALQRMEKYVSWAFSFSIWSCKICIRNLERLGQACYKFHPLPVSYFPTFCWIINRKFEFWAYPTLPVFSCLRRRRFKRAPMLVARLSWLDWSQLGRLGTTRSTS